MNARTLPFPSILPGTPSGAAETWPMLNCRAIAPTAWEHARKVLVFYFSRRHGRMDAEDLAQETLASVWSRNDYGFEKEQDFLRVCYGFARLILQKGYREARKHAGEELNASRPAAGHSTGGAAEAEWRILLFQICQVGASQLREKEWQLIQDAATSDFAGTARESTLADANTVRVRLHRARKKLARLTGWRRNRV